MRISDVFATTDHLMADYYKAVNNKQVVPWSPKKFVCTLFYQTNTYPIPSVTDAA